MPEQENAPETKANADPTEAKPDAAIAATEAKPDAATAATEVEPAATPAATEAKPDAATAAAEVKPAATEAKLDAATAATAAKPVAAAAATEKKADAPAAGASRPQGGARGGDRPPPRGDRGPRDRPRGGRPGGRRFYRRKKVDYFSVNKIDHINYKDAQMLKQFIGDRGKILPRRHTGLSAMHQRKLKIAIKRARNIALLPFAGDRDSVTGPKVEVAKAPSE